MEFIFDPSLFNQLRLRHILKKFGNVDEHAEIYEQTHHFMIFIKFDQI